MRISLQGKTLFSGSKRTQSKLCALLLFMLVAGIIWIPDAEAQNPVDILEADLLEGGTVEGQKVQKILGNVYLKSVEQNLEIYCDSAYQFVESSEIRAFGNIQINTENEKIWADSLVYFSDIDFSQLRGRVIIEADSTTLFGNSVDYRFSTKVAHFIDEIRLEDPDGILAANSGFYYREPDSAVFRGQVQLRDSTQYIEGDSLFSNRGKKYYEIYGDIFADDGENNSRLKGTYLEADSTGRRLLKGDAWLMNIDIDSTAESAPDTLIAQPENNDRLNSFRPDSLMQRPDSLRQEPPTSTEIKQVKKNSEADTTGKEVREISHQVLRSETLFSIAQTYRVSIEQIKQWNELTGNNLQAGQRLTVQLPPGTRQVTHTVADEETLFSISRLYNTEVSVLKSWNDMEDNTIQPDQQLVIYQFANQQIPPQKMYYTVKQGDNLFTIAQSYGMTLRELKQDNGLNTNAITVGQRLLVDKPGADSLSTPSKNIAVQEDTITNRRLPSLDKPRESRAVQQADTTHIFASRIVSVQVQTRIDTSNIINAYENVRIWSTDFSAVSDTARYNDTSETFELWSKAKAWHNDVQLSGPYIKVILKDGDVDRLESYPRPFSVQQDSVIDRLNQIKGDTLNAYFEQGNLAQIHVFGGSHLLRFQKNEANEPDGAIELTAPSTRIFFETGELTELKSKGNIDGSYLPESEQTAKRQLNGFIWTPELRPQRPKQRMERRFPPIPVERPFELPTRYLDYVSEGTIQSEADS